LSGTHADLLGDLPVSFSSTGNNAATGSPLSAIIVKVVDQPGISTRSPVRPWCE